MKRLLCFVLAFSMLLMMPVALAEGETPTLTVSEVQGEVGDRVTVVGSITDAPRCASFRIILTYDSACLKIFPDECVVGEDVTGNASINASALYQEKNAVLVMSVDTTKVIEGDAELFVLQFEVIAEPTSGYSTPITVDYQEFFNASLQKVTPTIQNGGVIYPSLDGGNYTDFAGGEGTVSSPYLVKNANHLNNVRKYLNAHFKMIADIEFSDADFAEGGSFYNGGAGWAPIGTDAASAFAGSFDGNGHVIRNLCININDDTDVYAGLFGYSKGIVQNLGMLNGEITVKHTTAAGAYAGSIAGCVESGTVRDCYSTCNVTTDWYSGGIVGRAYSAVIKDCFNTGNIVADYSAGGVTALASGSVRDCYNAGAITAGYYSGGVVGYNEQNAIIERCYNCGNVTVTESSSFEIMAHAGGIAGMSAADSLIRNCYNAGSISAQPSSGDLRSNAGGIAGYIYSAMVGDCYNVGVISGNYSGGIVAVNASGTIDGCYYLNTMDHGVGNGADTAITATANDLKTRATFLGYDFDTVWTFDGDLDYPYPV
ncbi:MAG: hypothetical protein IJ333_05310, partial [Clostridia bacterium]|nr:hypothetical protein [Clostridia bacterium]